MAAAALRRGDVFIIPTDTVYALTTIFSDKKAVEKIYRLKNIPPEKPLALYCRDFAQAASYIRMDNNQIFRLLKTAAPGPFTFVFQASKNLPQFTLSKQKTVGIRIIDHPVVQGLLERLDSPLVGSSLPLDDEMIAYPEDIEERYGKTVDGFIDSGPLEIEYSTILDCRDYPPEILRQGKGQISF